MWLIDINMMYVLLLCGLNDGQPVTLKRTGSKFDLIS